MKNTDKPTNPDITQLSPKFILAASTDPTRPVLNGILIDAENRAIVATNGRILAKIDIPGKKPVKAGYITAELWKAAKAMTKKGPIIVDHVAGTIGGLTYLPPDHAGTYPNYLNVIPAIGSPAYRFGFDPALALDLAQALGHEGKKSFATLEMDGDDGSAVLFTVGENRGVFMPARSAKGGPAHGLLVPAGTGDGAAPPAASHPLERTSMLKDPIAWLKKIDSELRHLCAYTPHGHYIADYLNLVDADAYVSREENEETEHEKETAEEEAKGWKELVTTICGKITDKTQAGFSHPDELGHLLLAITGLIDNGDTEIFISSEDLANAIETMRETNATPVDERIVALTETNRTQAARISELEDLLKQLQRPVASSPPQRPAPAKAERSAMPETKDTTSPATRPPTLTRNAEKKGIELRFDGKPSDTDRDAMKAHGFRWCPGQPGKPWVARYTEERWVFADTLAGQASPSPALEDPAALPPPEPEAQECHAPATPAAPRRFVGSLVDF